MANIYSSQIPPPTNWQDFESLCRDLWAKIWGNPYTQKNGRSGQPQHGIDVYGIPSFANGKYHGIQCKGKDNYTHSVLTVRELEAEVEKAKQFTPAIECFILATTSIKDISIEQRAREITAEHQKHGMFSVYAYGWRDIVEQLANHPKIIDKYYRWALTAHNSNVAIFNFWMTTAEIGDLKYNANILPFCSYNVRFKKQFLTLLESYLLKFEDYVNFPPACNADLELKAAVLNFNKVVIDVLNTCGLYENRYDILNDIYTYWVDTGDLPYLERGLFVDFRKWVLRALFYNLVKSANHVIAIWNTKCSSGSDTAEFIGFIETFNYSLLGEFEPSSPEYYPIYTKEEVEAGLYQGIESVEKHIKNQVYKD